MGAHHARAYALLGGAELVGVYDPDETQAATVSERYGVRAFATPEDLLREVDVVSIASPSHLHVEHALLALEHGRDVLVEKPVALTAADARALQQAVARDPRGPVVAAGHIEAFNPAVVELRKLLDGHKILGFDCRRLGPANSRNRDIDVVQDLMLHDLHIALDLIGSPAIDVHGAGAPAPGSDMLEYAVATVVFAGGEIATFGASRATEERVRRMSITALDVHVTVDLAARTLETCRSTNLREAPDAGVRQESVMERIFVPNEEPLLLQAASFLHACVHRRLPAVGLDVAVRCLELVDAVRDAAAGHAALPTALAS
jgi:predicted dehydrogenase